MCVFALRLELFVQGFKILSEDLLFYVFYISNYFWFLKTVNGLGLRKVAPSWLDAQGHGFLDLRQLNIFTAKPHVGWQGLLAETVA